MWHHINAHVRRPICGPFRVSSNAQLVIIIDSENILAKYTEECVKEIRPGDTQNNSLALGTAAKLLAICLQQI